MEILSEQLIIEIPKHDTMLNPTAFSTTDLNVPSTSCSLKVVMPATVSRTTGKGKGKGKSSKGKKRQTLELLDEEDDDNHKCPVCFGRYDDSADWIQCVECDKWLHGHCVGSNGLYIMT